MNGDEAKAALEAGEKFGLPGMGKTKVAQLLGGDFFDHHERRLAEAWLDALDWRGSEASNAPFIKRATRANTIAVIAVIIAAASMALNAWQYMNTLH